MITYKDTLEGIAVYVDGRKSGHIVAQSTGFMYVPNQSKDGSDVFSKLSDLKKSLEG